MSRAVEQPDGAGGFRVEGIPGLSRKAADFLRRRPREARMAVAAALETAAAQDAQPAAAKAYKLAAAKRLQETAAARDAQPAGKRRRSSSTEIPERLKPFLVSRPRSPDMLYAAQAAERLGVSRSTVYNWVRKGTLLAWQRRGRGLTIPAGQILGPRRVVPGLAEVMDIIGSARLTWVFLTEEWPLADDVAYPLEKLKSGQVQEVLDTAPAFGTTFT